MLMLCKSSPTHSVVTRYLYRLADPPSDDRNSFCLPRMWARDYTRVVLEFVDWLVRHWWALFSRSVRLSGSVWTICPRLWAWCWWSFSGTATMKGPVHNSQTEAYLRVASIAVALYEFCINSIWLKNLGTDARLTYSYVLTLPVEWRFYSSQSSIMRPRCVNGHWIKEKILKLRNLQHYLRTLRSDSIYEHSCPHRQYVFDPTPLWWCITNHNRQLWLFLDSFYPRELPAILLGCSNNERYRLLVRLFGKGMRWYGCLRRFFPVIQTMVSQCILGIRYTSSRMTSDHDFMMSSRTVNISGRAPWVKWVIVALFTTITMLEWFTNIYQRNRMFSFLLGPVHLDWSFVSRYEQCKW